MLAEAPCKPGDRVRVGFGRETWHVIEIYRACDCWWATCRASNRGTMRTFPTIKLHLYPLTDAERQSAASRSA
jgi:hypothetical protein